MAAKQAARTHLEQQRAALQAAQAGVQSWAARVGAAQQAVKDTQRALEAEHARVAQRDERCAALETAVGDAVAAHARYTNGNALVFPCVVGRCIETV